MTTTLKSESSLKLPQTFTLSSSHKEPKSTSNILNRSLHKHTSNTNTSFIATDQPMHSFHSTTNKKRLNQWCNLSINSFNTLNTSTPNPNPILIPNSSTKANPNTTSLLNKSSLGFEIKSIISSYRKNINNSILDFQHKRDVNQAFSKSYTLFQKQKLSTDMIKTHLASLKEEYSRRNVKLKDNFLLNNPFKKNPLLMKNKNDLALYYAERKSKERSASVKERKEIDLLCRLSQYVSNRQLDLRINENNNNAANLNRKNKKEKKGSILKLQYKRMNEEYITHKQLKEEEEYCEDIEKNNKDIKEIDALIRTIDYNHHSIEDRIRNDYINNNDSLKGMSKCYNGNSNDKAKVSFGVLDDQSGNSDTSKTTKHQSMALPLSFTSTPSFSLMPSLKKNNKEDASMGCQLQYKTRDKKTDKNRSNNNDDIDKLYKSFNSSSTKDPYTCHNRLLNYFKGKDIKSHSLNKSTPDDYMKNILFLNEKINGFNLAKKVSIIYPKINQDNIISKLNVINHRLQHFNYEYTKKVVSRSAGSDADTDVITNDYPNNI